MSRRMVWEILSMAARLKKRKPLNDSPARWKRLRTTYGLTREDYYRILSEQNGVCYICERPPEAIRPRRHLAVDHDHKTGRIRGLLCFNCNHKLLGWIIRDNIGMVRRLLKYLTRRTTYGKIPE